MKKNNKHIKRNLIINYVLIFIFVVLSTFFLKKSFIFQEAFNITYKENSDIDYKVYLKENEFYDTKYLGKDMLYVANLIDKININFNYMFDINEATNVDFEYNIIGKLTIADKNNNTNFFEKEYVLLDNKISKMNSSTKHVINEKIDIDYNYYNNLANRFRSNYGLDTNSNLTIYLNVHEKSDSEFDLNNNSVSSIIIPLSEKAIDISMNYQEVNKINKLIRSKSVIVNNRNYVIYGFISLLIGIIFIINYIRILLSSLTKKNKYDKYISKILREYDRLIVETTTKPNTKGLKVVDINRFEELLDVRDNLKLPIKYYIVKEHEESNFYITHDKEIYLYVVKEEKSKEKRSNSKSK